MKKAVSTPVKKMPDREPDRYGLPDSNSIESLIAAPPAAVR